MTLNIAERYFQLQRLRQEVRRAEWERERAARARMLHPARRAAGSMAILRISEVDDLDSGKT